ncbi:acetone carboxylase subunit gamma [Brevibacterium sp.]|uniref:acetone carboxylase subunit gamma n=1 Tax=Brevibacterium sp. TaxID=1701 RepID=UPI0026470F96|nr:acetone carboxylase subunit gamma [Brevibacterium sp.]MDN5833602.1 acetone carboxylase subunit gamma [Brevibacterium sp.]MDN6134793.1 acetone carboxylase subunit gamma [Brevibacterium sp.]MDN6192861.1 acetone carboxylase subunit gamma [Brevibacterium sp.]MDN6605223.1 acetone carboxylase subunit gamma [Brevibacterium sp.]
MTEYLFIDLNSERWLCRVCGQDLGNARGNYKEGTLVHDRDPEEIHPPLLDREKYQYTFSPDPVYCRILEYCCPGCGTQIEAEYLPPGHPPTVDMIWDIDSLKEQWSKVDKDPIQVINYGPDENALAELSPRFEDSSSSATQS